MSGDDIADLRVMLTRLSANLEAHIQMGDERSAAIIRRVTGIEDRVGVIEKDMPELIRSAVGDEIKQAGDKVRRLLVWIAAMALVVSQIMDAVRGVWQ